MMVTVVAPSAVKVEQIDDLVVLNDREPLYVLIAGGIAVGKTHIIRQNVKHVPIMDLDEGMERLGFTDYDDATQTGAAMKLITAEVEAIKARRQSMIAMGTASDLTFSINRLLWAKQDGYKTLLFHITAPLSQAVRQNRERIAAGLRGVKLEQADRKIRESIEGAARTVAALRYTALVDYFGEYNNTRL